MNDTPAGVPPEAWAEFRAALVSMTDEQRVDVFYDVHGGYCEYCGHLDPGGRGCQCWNDE